MASRILPLCVIFFVIHAQQGRPQRPRHKTADSQDSGGWRRGSEYGADIDELVHQTSHN